MIITLLGYMGAGKSTIGKQLASVLAYKFIDLDLYIENKYDKTIPEIFKDKGEIFFRKIEHDCLKELITKENNVVLSLGGGTPCYANNMMLLNKQINVVTCYLQLTPVSLTDRLFEERNARPLIEHITTKGQLQEFIGIHLFERKEFYQMATIVMPIDGLTVFEATENIVKKLY